MRASILVALFVVAFSGRARAQGAYFDPEFEDELTLDDAESESHDSATKVAPSGTETVYLDNEDADDYFYGGDYDDHAVKVVKVKKVVRRHHSRKVRRGCFDVKVSCCQKVRCERPCGRRDPCAPKCRRSHCEEKRCCEGSCSRRVSCERSSCAPCKWVRHCDAPCDKHRDICKSFEDECEDACDDDCGCETPHFFVDIYGGLGARLMDTANKGMAASAFGLQLGVIKRRSWSLGLDLRRELASGAETGSTPAFVQDTTLVKAALGLYPGGTGFSLELAAGVPVARQLVTRDNTDSLVVKSYRGSGWEASLDLGYTWFFTSLFIRPSVEFARGRLGDDGAMPVKGTTYDQALLLFRLGAVIE